MTDTRIPCNAIEHLPLVMISQTCTHMYSTVHNQQTVITTYYTHMAAFIHFSFSFHSFVLEKKIYRQANGDRRTDRKTDWHTNWQKQAKQTFVGDIRAKASIFGF